MILMVILNLQVCPKLYTLLRCLTYLMLIKKLMTSVLRRIPPFLHTAFLFCIWQNMGISVVFFLRFLLYQSSFFSFLSIYSSLHIYFIISLLYSPPFLNCPPILVLQRLLYYSFCIRHLNLIYFTPIVDQ